MQIEGTIRRLPWEGMLVDLLLLGLWQWALPLLSAWCIEFPHLAVWTVALLQALAVGRMVALYFDDPSASHLLGPFAPLGTLAAVLAVGSFLWLLGAMFSSPVQWGFWTQRLPVFMIFATVASLGLNLELADTERTWKLRLFDSSLVVLYLLFAESLLFGFLEAMERDRRVAMFIVLLLCHLPIPLIFTLVTSKSRYDLISATFALAMLLMSVATG